MSEPQPVSAFPGSDQAPSPAPASNVYQSVVVANSITSQMITTHYLGALPPCSTLVGITVTVDFTSTSPSNYASDLAVGFTTDVNNNLGKGNYVLLRKSPGGDAYVALLWPSSWNSTSSGRYVAQFALGTDTTLYFSAGVWYIIYDSMSQSPGSYRYEVSSKLTFLMKTCTAAPTSAPAQYPPTVAPTNAFALDNNSTDMVFTY